MENAILMIKRRNFQYFSKIKWEAILVWLDTLDTLILILMFNVLQLFCDNVEPHYRKWQLKHDDHSIGPARINGIARNSIDFAEIWNCSSKSNMNPPKKCVFW